ncbi:MAG: GNAT family N-acetyltransferase [Acidobacteria bacterium]|nr:GNAT family N-acetyltransferase [Acidobacteriota bacterium]
MTTIEPITAADEDDWRPLWHGYLTFYETELASEVTADAFARLTRGVDLHGALARDDDGRAIGLVHWLFHPATWSTTAYCYLEDLYVSPDARGAGAGTALIAHVRAQAEAAGAAKVYWLTQEGNTTARALYDRVASLTDFRQYAIAL